MGATSAAHPAVLQTQLLCRVATCSLWSTFRSWLQDWFPSPSLSSSLPRTHCTGSHPSQGQRRLGGLGTPRPPSPERLPSHLRALVAQFAGHNAGLTLDRTGWAGNAGIACVHLYAMSTNSPKAKPPAFGLTEKCRGAEIFSTSHFEVLSEKVSLKGRTAYLVRLRNAFQLLF